MNTLVLDLSADDEPTIASGYDAEEMPIPLDAVFFGEPRVRVWVVNLRRPNGKHYSMDPFVVPAVFAHLMLAGAKATSGPQLWPPTANPEAKTKDHNE